MSVTYFHFIKIIYIRTFYLYLYIYIRMHKLNINYLNVHNFINNRIILIKKVRK